MTISQETIDLMKVHYTNGCSVSQIFIHLGKKVTKITIRNWIKRFKNHQFFPIKNSGRPRTIRTYTNIIKVKNLLKLKHSARLISKKLKLNRESVRRIIKQDLKLKPYRFIRCSKLTEAQKIKRKKFAIWWKKSYKKKFNRQPILFSDEKIFSIDGGMNKKNRVIYSDSRDTATKKGF